METERAIIQSREIEQPDRRKGRPSAAQAADIHRHILDTAWSLFMRRGFDGVTVSDIAKQGNLSKRTIYDRFQNKDAIFVAVLESRITAWTDDLARPICDVDFRGWLSTFAERTLRLTMNDQVTAMDRLTNSESNRFPHIFRITAQGYADAFAILTNGVSAELARCERTPRDETIMARCWFDMLIGHAQSSYRMSFATFDIDTHVAEWRDRLVDLFFLMLGVRSDDCVNDRGL